MKIENRKKRKKVYHFFPLIITVIVVIINSSKSSSFSVRCCFSCYFRIFNNVSYHFALASVKNGILNIFMYISQTHNIFTIDREWRKGWKRNAIQNWKQTKKFKLNNWEIWIKPLFSQSAFRRWILICIRVETAYFCIQFYFMVSTSIRVHIWLKNVEQVIEIIG